MIGVYIPASPITEEQYRRLDERVTAGGLPDGLKLHTCFREGDGLAVFDVWDSKEAFDAFGERLMPAAGELGLTISTPIFVEMIAFDVP
jgi:uncharacterized protein YeaC (DUF1315 family)